MREDNSDIPNFEDKLERDSFILNIIVSPQLVLKHLKALNTFKACGRDNCHPFFIQQCTEEFHIPLSEIFQKSVSTGSLPSYWKLANVTCIFKKR